MALAPSADGVLTATGLSYLAHCPHAPLRFVRSGFAQPALGEAFLEVPVIEGLARRVYRGFAARLREGCPRVRGGRCQRGCPSACARRVYTIAAADDEAMPEALHAFLVGGFDHGREVRSLAARDPRIAQAEAFHTLAVNESEKARQFVRFSELSTGAFFALYTPKANVLPLVAGHFARRMEGERFLLADPKHRTAVLLSEGRLVCGPLSEDEVAELSRPHELSGVERSVRALWKRFYDALALHGRGKLERGYDLRANFMPKRIAEGLVELDPSVDDGWSEGAWAEAMEDGEAEAEGRARKPHARPVSREDATQNGAPGFAGSAVAGWLGGAGS